MVNRITFAVPGDLATPTGGYAYDRRIIAELQFRWQIGVVSVGDGFPQPNPRLDPEGTACISSSV